MARNDILRSQAVGSRMDGDAATLIRARETAEDPFRLSLKAPLPTA